MEQIGSIGFWESGIFPRLLCDYIERKKELRSFFGLFPDKENFEEQIKIRSNTAIDRELLASRLSHQYSNLKVSDPVKENIDSFRNEKTFCVVTGHQLNLLSGPIFFHYKIQTAIAVCKDLSEKYPNYRFVPVYWMATEDHDFEEINNFRIAEKRYEWESGQKGPVGRFNLKGLGEVLRGVEVGTNELSEKYSKGNWAEAHRAVCNYWYGDDGLVIIDGDDSELKRSFIPFLKNEIKESFVYEGIMEASEKLESLKYDIQVNPRKINLFYLGENSRDRLEKTGDGLIGIANGGKTWTEEEILKEVDDYPERFSPNVVLRPLFQEHILPNLAYVGGPGEISYWLQSKPAFDKIGIPFPILFPRIFSCLLPTKYEKWWEELGFDLIDLFRDQRELELKWMKDQMGDQFSLVREFQKLKEMEGQMLDMGKKADPTLVKYVGARSREMEKILEGISKKLRKALERNEQTNLSRLKRVKSYVFPEGEIQERSQNFLSFFPEDLGPLKGLGELVDPWDFSVKLLRI
jgi:bacillithiol synthase